MPPPKTKRELQSFLGIVTYIGKFSGMAAEVYKPVRRLTSDKVAWIWNRFYQEVYERVK